MSEQDEFEKKMIKMLDKLNHKIFKMKEKEFYRNLFFVIELIPAFMILLGLGDAIVGVVDGSQVVLNTGFVWLIFGAMFAYLVLKIERRLEKNGKGKGAVIFRSRNLR